MERNPKPNVLSLFTIIMTRVGIYLQISII